MLVPGFDHDTLIARSAFARVYRAHQLSFDRDVVIKVLEQVPADDEGRRRFAEQCAAMGRLTGHPGIMTVLDSGFTSDGHPFLITPFCPQGSMADRLAADGPLPVDQVVAVARAITDALAVGHAAGLLHLDVKPENIVITPFGPPALTDFGLTALSARGPGEITAAVAVDHLAPEVLSGRPPSPASDLYALGSTLWTLLAGHPPFPADGGLVERMRRVQQDVPAPIGRADLPDDLVALLGELLAKDPGARPSADALRHRLDDLSRRDRSDRVVVGAAAMATPALDDPALDGPALEESTANGLIDLRDDGDDQAGDEDDDGAGDETRDETRETIGGDETEIVPSPIGEPAGPNGRDPAGRDSAGRDPAYGGGRSGSTTESTAPLPLISPDPRELLTATGSLAPGALAVADDPELGAPAPPAPWTGRMTSWDELGGQPVGREAPVVGAGATAAMGAAVGSSPESLAWADAAPRPSSSAEPQWGAYASPAPAAGAPAWAQPANPANPADLAMPAGPGRSGRRRRWPVIVATLVAMLLAAGATLAVLSRSRSDQETVQATDSTPSATTTTVAPETTTIPPTTAAPAPAPAPTPAPTAAPTTAAPAPAAVVVPAGTGQVSIPAGVDPTVTASANAAQQAATALANGNWAVARSLIPQLASTSDTKLAEGWGNLEHATVVVTSARGNADGTVSLRIGVVADERNTDGSPRTNLYCATWTMRGNQIISMSDDQVVGGQPWKAGTWADPREGIDLLRRSCRPFS